jgi:hypothetical protein
MSKKRPWYGRPNAPPLNWDTLDKPVVRHVLYTSDICLPDNIASTAETKWTAVALTRENWITVLKALQLYSQSYGDAPWKEWRLRVRETIIGTLNPVTDRTQAVAVRLPLSDWRRIWQAVNTVSQERGERWRK